MSQRPFQSVLAAHLTEYLQFKVRLGYTSFRRCQPAYDFDRYILRQTIQTASQITEGFLTQWLHAVPGRSAITQNKKLQFVKGFLRYLERLHVIADNPALRIPYLSESRYHPYLYTLHDIHILLKEAARLKGTPGQTLPTFLHLLYACGLRLGEALRLRLEDVDFEENTLSLWNTKFHKERLVPFSHAIAQKLKAYLDFRLQAFPPANDKAFFFSNAHGAFSPNTIRGQFHTVLLRSQLVHSIRRGGPRLHDLRHAFAVHRLYKWYQEGHDILNKLPLLSTYMGHVRTEDTQLYLTVTQALLREGDRRFQNAFEDLASQRLKRMLHDPQPH
jgi:site-specific recombinase XerD